MRVEVDFDDRWFLPIPAHQADWETWAADAVAALTIDDQLRSNTGDVVSRMLASAGEADASAAVNFLFCPDGLPGVGVVSVYASATDLTDIRELFDEAPASLPRRAHPMGAYPADEARIITTVRQLPEGQTLGMIQCQLLRDGALIESIATSTNLPKLSSGIDWFAELTDRVSVSATGVKSA